MDNNIQKFRVAPWFKKDGDNTLRLDYKLNADSIVFDVGGYLGESSQKIWDKFKCNIYVFEPVKEFAEQIRIRFEGNDKVKVFQFGLSDKNTKINISVDKDRSSLYKEGEDADSIELKSISEFINNNKITKIDLIEINIEGGEYDLLTDLINTNLISIVDNVQVQFHDFVEDTQSRMKKIQDNLSKTHYPTFQYEYVWENWKRKEENQDSNKIYNLVYKTYNQVKEALQDNIELRREVEKLNKQLEEKSVQIDNSKISISGLQAEVERFKNSKSYKIGYKLLHPKSIFRK